MSLLHKNNLKGEINLALRALLRNITDLHELSQPVSWVGFSIFSIQDQSLTLRKIASSREASFAIVVTVHECARINELTRRHSPKVRGFIRGWFTAIAKLHNIN